MKTAGVVCAAVTLATAVFGFQCRAQQGGSIQVMIEDIAKKISDGKTSVAEIILDIGDVSQKQSSAYRVAPRDERLAWARVAVKADSHGQEALRFVDLAFKPTAGLKLKQLDQTFGPREHLEPSPEGNPFRVEYRYDKPGRPFVAPIVVSLSGPPEEDQSIIEEVTILRETR
jgi:hypothetical protein